MTSTVDMSVEINRLAAWRRMQPKVHAYEHAAELGMHPTALSKFENEARAELPNGKTFEEYRAALVRVKRSKGATEAQIAPWAGEAA